MANTQTLLAQAYSAFNQRHVDAALALVSENVSWPKASEGGRVVGGDKARPAPFQQCYARISVTTRAGN